MAVAEVTRDDRSRDWPRPRASSVSENVPLPWPRRYRPRPWTIGDGQVNGTVAEVCRPRSASGPRPPERDGRQGLEIPSALVGEDGDVARAEVGDRQVDPAVVLEVTFGDRRRA